MQKTGAEVLIERGRLEGRQEGELLARRSTLLMLLRGKFGKVPAKVVKRVDAEADAAQLDGWLEGVLSAQSLDDLGIV
jgi:hypothetical protein